jgi:hypothetical protein
MIYDASEQEDHDTIVITPSGSVYDYMLFLIPTSRARHGSAWSKDTRHAIIFFAMNIFLQLFLTLIAGAFVLAQVTSWKQSLVSSPDIFSYMFDKSTALASQGAGMLGRNWTYGGPTYLSPGEEYVSHCGHEHGDMVNKTVLGPEAGVPSTGASFLYSETVAFMHMSEKKPGGSAKGSSSSKATSDESMTELFFDENVYRPAPLCAVDKKGMITCLPPSVKFADHWTDLDQNGDGVWTREEAEKDAAGLRCLLHMRPSNIFIAISNFMRVDHENHEFGGFWVSPDVKEGVAIPKPYFEIWTGLVGICIHSDVAMCGSLILRGIFDGALNKEKSNYGAITDLGSAMAFCDRALQPGGLCDQALPQTFQLYRARHASQCGEATFMAGPVYSNPYDKGDMMYVAKASFAEVTSYEDVNCLKFQVFQYCVLLVFLVSLCAEMFDLRKLLEFILVFPSPTKGTDEQQADECVKQDPETLRVTILALTWDFRFMIAISWVCRLIITVYIGVIGTNFLLADRDYVNLLLNAVALVFVFEIDELLYVALGTAVTKMEIENTTPIEFTSYFTRGHLTSRLLDRDFWGLVLLPITVLCIVAYNVYFATQPALEALTCACSQEGAKCVDAFLYDKPWFDGYWSVTLPAAMSAIDNMRWEALKQAKHLL